MNDVLDEKLHAHGRRWVAAQQPPPSFDDAMARASGQRDHRLMLAVAAALVVLLVAVGVPLVRSLGGGTDGHAPGPAARSATAPSPTAPSSTGPSAVHDSVGRTIKELIKHARSAAIVNQDPDATAEAVRTTYRNAERVALDGDTSSSPPADTTVWVVQLRGTFTCTDCKGPASVHPPTGTAIVLVLNAKTFTGYDFALTKQPHDLAKLGRVVRLPI